MVLTGLAECSDLRCLELRGLQDVPHCMDDEGEEKDEDALFAKSFVICPVVSAKMQT